MKTSLLYLSFEKVIIKYNVNNKTGDYAKKYKMTHWQKSLFYNFIPKKLVIK